MYYRGARAVVVVYDMSSKESFEKVHHCKQLQQALEYMHADLVKNDMQMNTDSLVFG